MRLAVAAVSVVVLLCYALLAHRSETFGLLYQRGGAVTLSLSLLFANAGAHLAGASWQRFADRVQILGAVCIWVLVQLGCMIYMLYARV